MTKILNVLIFTDTEIPTVLDTPSNKTVNTDARLPNARVSWTPPTAIDNSGEAVTLASDYSPGDTFPIGTTTVTYTAMDPYGNTATSTFNVIVIGKYAGQFQPDLVKEKAINGTFIFFGRRVLFYSRL